MKRGGSEEWWWKSIERNRILHCVLDCYRLSFWRVLPVAHVWHRRKWKEKNACVRRVCVGRTQFNWESEMIEWLHAYYKVTLIKCGYLVSMLAQLLFVIRFIVYWCVFAIISLYYSAMESQLILSIFFFIFCLHRLNSTSFGHDKCSFRNHLFKPMPFNLFMNQSIKLLHAFQFLQTSILLLLKWIQIDILTTQSQWQTKKKK